MEGIKQEMSTLVSVSSHNVTKTSVDSLQAKAN